MTDYPEERVESDIPAGVTYFGQFLVHDITLSHPPIRMGVIEVHNERDRRINLDSLYGRGEVVNPHYFRRTTAARQIPRFLLGGVRDTDKVRLSALSGDTVPTSIDLPRTTARLAMIADPRNDENSIISQIHAAFLGAHNRAAGEHENGACWAPDGRCPGGFECVRRALTNHYQWLIVNDYLPKLVSGKAARELDAARKDPASYFSSRRTRDWYPAVESVFAALRFGHPMARDRYALNRALPEDFPFFPEYEGQREDLNLLGFKSVPSCWDIDWSLFFGNEIGAGPSPQRAMMISTKLPRAFGRLPGIDPTRPESNLAYRTLLAGELLGLAVGEELAAQLKCPLIRNCEADGTPLWLYILREAEELEDGGGRLGQLGSRMLLDLVMGLLAQDTGAYWNSRPEFRPTLGLKASKETSEYSIQDLLEYGRELVSSCSR